jgi:hypothetical protein
MTGKQVATELEKRKEENVIWSHPVSKYLSSWREENAEYICVFGRYSNRVSQRIQV